MPVITELSHQKKNQNRFNLFIDGAFYSGVSVATVANFMLHKDKEITEAQLIEIVVSDIEERLFDRACNYLGKGLRTKHRVVTYLNDLFFRKNGVWWAKEIEFDRDKVRNSIIGRLERITLLNDKAFAEAFIRERSKFKPKSKYALKLELQAKGVDSKLADEVLDSTLGDESELLKLAYRKKFKETVLTQDDSKKIDFLRRKGFNWEQISQFIRGQNSTE